MTDVSQTNGNDLLLLLPLQLLDAERKKSWTRPFMLVCVT